MKYSKQIIFPLAVIIFLIALLPGQSQAVAQPSTAPPVQQDRLAGDPVRQLNLSPEQREQIRSIREQSRSERSAINERLRNTNRALEEVLESDNPNEALVEQRMRDVAEAQAASMRMRILTEVKIRRVLTVEQRDLLRNLRRRAHEFRRERHMGTPEEKQKRREERSIRMRNRRRGMRPILRQADPSPRVAPD